MTYNEQFDVFSRALYYQRFGLSARLCVANVELDKHMRWVNETAWSAQNYMLFCTGPGCMNHLAPAYAVYAGLVCQECYHRSHITCKRCGLEHALSDMSEKRTGHCVACDLEQTAHESTVLRESIETMLCDFLVDPNCVDRLRRTLAFMQHEQRKGVAK